MRQRANASIPAQNLGHDGEQQGETLSYAVAYVTVLFMVSRAQQTTDFFNNKALTLVAFFFDN